MTYMVIATLKCSDAQMRSEFIPLLAAHRKRSLENEPGTLRFECGISVDKDDLIILQETYDNGDAFRAHWEGESNKLITEECAKRGIEIEIRAWHGTSIQPE